MKVKWHQLVIYRKDTEPLYNLLMYSLYYPDGQCMEIVILTKIND